MSAAPLSKARWDSPVTMLLGVGPERAAQLERLGIRTLGDFLLHGPRRYEDRRKFRAIGSIDVREPVAARGRIIAMGVKRFRHGSRSVFEMILDDGTGRLHCRWWNMPYMEERFEQGQEVMVYGRVVDLKPRAMDHPETEIVESGEETLVHLDRIVPVYPLTEGLSQRWVRGRVWSLLEHLPPVEDPRPGIPAEGLPGRAQALRDLHFPNEAGDAEQARKRLAFDEFVELQLEIQKRRRVLLARARGLQCGGDNRLMRPFLASLGFRLTDSQTRVLREIRRDMASGKPMRRLTQGDVGSGKTVVAAAAALMAIESGYSVALMAPTDLLARQHEARFREWFEPLGIEVVLRTGSARNGAASTRAAMVVGTHALISAGTELANLGLVIIDEQHKFGVAQRETLVRKGTYPHLLVMTATPIPRTLALTVYGDLDVSVIEGLPPGRGRIRTFVRTRETLPKVWEFVRGQLDAGRQAYIVFPRLEEDDGGQVKAVRQEHQNLQAVLAPHRVGMMHGKLRAEEKERTMNAFRQGELQALVATVVIEVGVDVANATVMVVENAEHFGLAQLHQLRGRIGRGGQDSHCVLIAGKEDPEILERLRILERCADGFQIAEEDLKLRGPGEMLGQSQSGAPSLRFGDLRSDRALLEQARKAVSEWISKTAGPKRNGASK